MPVSEQPILQPQPRRPGVPLRKSTLAVLALLLLALGLLSSLLLSAGSASPSASPAVAKDLHELRRTGSEQALRDEEAEAARAARSKQPVSSAALPASTPASARPPLPSGVRRDDNSSAFFDRNNRRAGPAAPAGLSTQQRDLELEAQTRMGKAVVADYDPPRSDSRASGAGPSAPAGELPAQPSAAVQAPSAAVAGRIDAIAQQLRAAQGASAAAPRTREDWMREYAGEGGRSRVLAGYQAPTTLVLRQGKVIPAVLARAINSDLPGLVTARVSADVHDADGQLLIPRGATLIGRYDAGVRAGQNRLLFAFERLLLPNGLSFDLPAAPGADLAGAAGMTGDVDNHFLKMFGTSLLIALLADHAHQPAAVTQYGSSGPSTAAGQVLSDVSRTVLERNRVIPPTISVPQGTRINVEVVADMVFPSPYPRR